MSEPSKEDWEKAVKILFDHFGEPGHGNPLKKAIAQALADERDRTQAELEYIKKELEAAGTLAKEASLVAPLKMELDVANCQCAIMREWLKLCRDTLAAMPESKVIPETLEKIGTLLEVYPRGIEYKSPEEVQRLLESLRERCAKISDTYGCKDLGCSESISQVIRALPLMEEK